MAAMRHSSENKNLTPLQIHVIIKKKKETKQMNIEGITLLNQFIEYSCKPLIVLTIIIIGTLITLISIFLLEDDKPIGVLVLLIGLVSIIIFGAIASEEEYKTFLNDPAYTHYIIQIDDKAAWSEIAPNYTIVEEIYPNTNIYEIKKVYEEGDEQ